MPVRGRLKPGVIPSVFKWTKNNGSGDVNREETTFGPEYKARSGETNRSVVIHKLNTGRIEEEEATDTASEGERDEVVGRPSFVSRKTQKTVTNNPEKSQLKVNKIFHVLYCPVNTDFLSIILSASVQQTKRKEIF